jgi:plasmid stabilization system protein ParE
MRQIRWNRLASQDYYDNIDYLLKNWTEKEAQNFIDEVDEI